MVINEVNRHRESYYDTNIIHCVAAAFIIEMLVTISISFLTGYVGFLPPLHCSIVVFKWRKQYINVRAQYASYARALTNTYM